jgi:Uncharacterised nucleotidyltransferase
MRSSRSLHRDVLRILTGERIEGIDWRGVIQLACETLTIGTLADRALLSFGERDLPDDVHALLTDVRDRARHRNTRLVAQLAELLPALNRDGVKPVVMRGMARLLGSPAEQSRLLSDIDLLVPLKDLPACLRATSTLGYESLTQTAQEGFPTVLGRSSDVGTVDLHTRLRPFSIDIDFDRIASTCAEIELEGGKVLVPSPTTQLLFNIVHDQLHDRDYWRGLIDIRHLAEMPALIAAGVDWDALCAFFQSRSAKNALEIQLRTALHFFDVEIPRHLCGGTWAKLQVLRREWQLRHPRLFEPLTMLTLAVDPPAVAIAAIGPVPRRRGRASATKRMRHLLRVPAAGKLQTKSSAHLKWRQRRRARVPLALTRDL